jgi:hypothetical protein
VSQEADVGGKEARLTYVIYNTQNLESFSLHVILLSGMRGHVTVKILDNAVALEEK